MDNTELMVQEQKHELAQQGVFSTIESFKEIYDIGKMFASSSLVPQNFQGKSMDCTIAVDMANRMNVSPMFVMQNLYVVKGKPQWSGQACTTLIMASKKFKNIKHRYTGERGKDTWGCYVEALRIEDGEIVRGTEVTIQMAKDEKWYEKDGSKWKTMPEQMLAYRASTFFARVHVPNALMGVYVDGEVEDISKADRIPTDDPFKTEIMNEAEEQFK